MLLIGQQQLWRQVACLAAATLVNASSYLWLFHLLPLPFRSFINTCQILHFPRNVTLQLF